MILILMLLIPLLASFFVMCLSCSQSKLASYLSDAIILSSLSGVLIIAAKLYNGFDKAFTGMQFVANIKGWFALAAVGGNADVAFHVGIDGASLLFIILSAVLTPCACFWIRDWHSTNSRMQLGLLLLMEALSIGVFIALDLTMLYVFFELTLLPMFFIIGIWGGDKRRYAAFKFFLYTAFGSILMLLAIIYILLHLGTTDIIALPFALKNISAGAEAFLWWAFFIGFAIKIPMFPLHSWLPDAHVQAPTYGSVLLAGILIKMGAYGFIRVLLPLFPELSLHYAPLVYAISAIAIVYSSFVAMAQEEMKKVIAYSSIAHMGLVTMGLFSFNAEGINGALFQMVSHGLVSAALFFCIGLIYESSGSKLTRHFSGLAVKMPRYAVFFLIFTMAAVGLPGTSGFVGEFLVMQGIVQVSFLYTALTASGIILSACYMLPLYRRMMKGPLLDNTFTTALNDCSWIETSLFFFVASLVIALGLYPRFILEVLI